MNALVYVNIDQGRVFISEKDKVARNDKQKKLHGFSYYKNIANFEEFWRDKNISKNLLFLGSVYPTNIHILPQSDLLQWRMHFFASLFTLFTSNAREPTTPNERFLVSDGLSESYHLAFYTINCFLKPFN